MPLKILEYDGLSRYCGGAVVYWASEFTCVYSGITSCVHSTSTIDAAEELIIALLVQERFLIRIVNFYDLQTCRGYPQIDIGDFKYDSVFYHRSSPVTNIHRTPSPCPTEIMRYFQRWIGPQPTQINLPLSVLSE